MLVDLRTYHVRPNTMAQHMSLYEKHGFAVQSRHLGPPLAYLVTESGADVNGDVHIWTYADAADRAEKRAAMQADPAWHEMQRLSAEAGYLVRQENRLMVPAPFFTFPAR